MSSNPDYSGQNQAALMGAQTQQQYLQYVQQEMARTQGVRDEATQLGLASARQAGDAQNILTQQLRQRTDAESALLADAKAYDTPGKKAEAAAAAGADVEAALGTARAGTMDALARRGITGGRAAALIGDQAIQAAKLKAAATTNAVRGVEDTAFARKAQATGLTSGVNAGTLGTTGAAQALQASQSGQAAMGQAYGQVGSAYGQLAGTLGQSNAAQQQNANGTNQALATAGTLMVMY